MKAALTGILLFLLATSISGDDSNRAGEYGVGAVYTATNGATKNQIAIYRLHINGKLTRAGTVDTKGIGVNSTHEDVLVSQSPIAIYSNYLFVVNAGSNSLSMFWINPKDATQLTFISMKPANGEYSVSVTANSRYACVLTGGRRTGFRCFTYNLTGLYVVPSFDRNLTAYVSHDIPLLDPIRTFGQILFSQDGRCLIITVKGIDASSRGYLLFFPLLNNGNQLSLKPIMQRPPGASFPFAMSYIGNNGLIIADGLSGVVTLRFSSTTGAITDTALKPVNTSIIDQLCWSTYAPTIGNYFLVGVGPPGIIEVHVNLGSTTNPIQIVRYYPIAETIGSLDTTVVTLAGVDYLYVIGIEAHVINSYRLDGPGNAVFNEAVVVQRNAENLPKLVGMVAYLQQRSSSTY